MRKLTAIFLIFIVVTSIFLIFVPVEGDTITTTAVFYTPTSDGYVYRDMYTEYAPCHNEFTGWVDYGGTYQIGGQRYYEENYWWYAIFRAINHFDTSSLPDDAAIVGVTLSLYILEDHSDADFDVTVQSSTTFPHNPIEAGDYYYGYYTTEGGSRSTSEIGGAGYWNITFNSVGLDYVSKTDYTRLMIRSSKDIDAVAPEGDEYATFASRDSGEAYAAKLYVTYTVGVTTTSTSTTSTSSTTSTTTSTTSSTTTSETTSTSTSTYETTITTEGSTITTTATTESTTTATTEITTESVTTITTESIVTTTISTGSTISGGHIVKYILHGPYYEDGVVADAFVNVTLYQRYNTTINLGFNGSDLVADEITVLLAQPAMYMLWNVTASENYTRSFYFFQDETFEEIWIFIPRTTEPCYPYTFVPADFYGMKNPYLSTQINVDGVIRTVERKKVETNQVTFFMIQWRNYDLTWRCDQGTYTQGFNAENTFTNSLVILAGAFATTTNTMPSASAGRLNSTCIHVSYADSMEATYWLFLNITHQASGGGYEIDYTINMTSNSYSLYWNVADNETDYTVYIVAYTYTGLWSWRYPCPITPTSTNPFEGLLDFIGDWQGINPAQIPAMVIILLCLAIGSARSTGVSCLLAWIIAAIFAVMGWYVVSVPTFAFAGATSILVWIAEGKETVREI